MTGPLPLPVPYLPGVPGSGLGTTPEEFAQNVQQNFDKVALAVGGAEVINSGDAAGGDLTGTYPNPTIGTGKVTVAKTETGIFLELKTTGTSRKVKFGRTTQSFSGASSAGPFQIPHGLGVTPQVVLVTVEDTGVKVFATTGTTDATNFDLYLRDFTLAANSSSYVINWLAIG